MSETLSRILKREKPKAEIIENMTRTFFKNTSGDEAVISIKPNKMTRTQKQNAMYWAIIEQVRVETGNTKDAIHDHCRKEFLETRVEEVANKPVVVLKSTTSLNTKEMGLYCDEVIMWIEDDLGIRLQLPDDWRDLIG
tara:strand:- start:695 stop:1108 length:414 start_codon:yes stop_codon:yes gene_type:complete